MESSSEIPSDFICPITQLLIENAVIAEDGITYEEAAIKDWVNRNNTSPVTREKISKRLIKNRAIQNQILDFKNKLASKRSPIKLNNSIGSSYSLLAEQENDSHKGKNKIENQLNKLNLIKVHKELELSIFKKKC